VVVFFFFVFLCLGVCVLLRESTFAPETVPFLIPPWSQSSTEALSFPTVGLSAAILASRLWDGARYTYLYFCCLECRLAFCLMNFLYARDLLILLYPAF